MDEIVIFGRLESDFKYLQSLGYNVLGVFLQGSQNYGLSDKDSDIDTKAIIIPTLDEIVKNSQPVSTTLALETNEHIDVKDIRLMHKNFEKQNINFIEILFTKFRLINEKYAHLYQPMFDNAEQIAHFNEVAAVKTMRGMAEEKYHALTHDYPSKQYEIAKWGFDPKQLHHIFRLEEFIGRYINGVDYEKCLISNQCSFLTEVKRNRNDFLDLKTAQQLADKTVERIRAVCEDFLSSHEVSVNLSAKRIMEKCLYDVIKQSLKDEVVK